MKNMDKRRRSLCIFIWTLLVLTCLPWALYIKGDNGTNPYYNYYLHVSMTGLIFFPISGFITVMALLVAYNAPEKAQFVTGLLLIAAGAEVFCWSPHILTVFTVLTYVITFGQIIGGLITTVVWSIPLFRKKANGTQQLQPPA